MIKFLADMGISPRTVDFLRGLGYQATHLSQEGMERMPDSEILEKARREDRILLTHDLDFGHLLAASGDQLPSVIVFRLRNMSPEQVNRYIHYAITHHREALDHGAIVAISEAGVRVRLLPVSAPK
jgi:predicted nuclease of predicted toxin-antitoxin system